MSTLPNWHPTPEQNNALRASFEYMQATGARDFTTSDLIGYLDEHVPGVACRHFREGIYLAMMQLERAGILTITDRTRESRQVFAPGPSYDAATSRWQL